MGSGKVAFLESGDCAEPQQSSSLDSSNGDARPRTLWLVRDGLDEVRNSFRRNRRRNLASRKRYEVQREAKFWPEEICPICRVDLINANKVSPHEMNIDLSNLESSGSSTSCSSRYSYVHIHDVGNPGVLAKVIDAINFMDDPPIEDMQLFCAKIRAILAYTAAPSRTRDAGVNTDWTSPGSLEVGKPLP